MIKTAIRRTEDNVKLLKELYENTSMGIEGALILAEKAKDEEIYDNVVEYSKECEEIKDCARELLREIGEIPESISGLEKARLWLGTEMNVLFDKSLNNIVTMLIKGSTMGIIAGEKNRNSYENIDAEVLKLDEEFIEIQHDFIGIMKKYLVDCEN